MHFFHYKFVCLDWSRDQRESLLWNIWNFLVCYRAGKGASRIGSRKRYVIQGTVIKKSTKSDTYKIRFITPYSSEKKKDQRFFVENVTALTTQSQASKRTQRKRDSQRKLKEHRKKFAIQLQPYDRYPSDTMQNNMGSDYICVNTHAIGCLKAGFAQSWKVLEF